VDGFHFVTESLSTDNDSLLTVVDYVGFIKLFFPRSLLKLPKLKKISINKRTVLETPSLDIIQDLENKGVQVIKLEDSDNL